ncbi:hypothetical protein FM104_13060 [Microbacterium esteraromaticum]|uniref:ATPase n=2 Tax=Microbacterium esteraromaticum TaxID=57043 RepID=A0A1R4KHX1_9MICO|nr:hypothetical protein FM104_13060 [Microbacterium esteraromaticum]
MDDMSIEAGTATAVILADGTGRYVIDGVPAQVREGDPDAARQVIVDRVIEHARQLGSPVPFRSTDPDGTWELVVQPNGAVEVVEAATAPEPSRKEPVAVATSAPQAESIAPIYELPARAPLHERPPARSTWRRESDGQQVPPIPRAAPAPVAPAPVDSATTTRREQRTRRESFIAAPPVQPPADEGLRGFLARFGIRLKPSEAETARRVDRQCVSQHWPGPRTLAVANGKGGAGKTPVSILLAAVFAKWGGAGIVAWDNNQFRGTLGWRTASGPHDATILDLLPQVPYLLSTEARSADLAHYVHHQPDDQYDILRSKPTDLADRQRVEPRDVDHIHQVLSKYYRMIIMDSGNDESDPMWRRMIDLTDQLVVPTTTRADHAEAAALLLEALTDQGGAAAELAENAVVVITQADPHAKAAEITKIKEGFAGMVREVVHIPFDPAIVNGVLRFDALRPETQRACLAMGAAVARGL